MLPFSYATRNLLRDPSRLIQKVGGVAMVVFLVFAAGAFNGGMKRMLMASGSGQNVILLSAGSEESVERSEISVEVEGVAANIAGIEHRLDQPAVSGEVHFMGKLQVPGLGDAQALLRGVVPSAFEVHREVRIIEGDYPGSGEVLIGRLAHHTLDATEEDLSVGSTVIFEDEAFTVSGIFQAPGTVMESEVWMNRMDLMTLTQRDSLSCVVVRLGEAGDLGMVQLFTKQRLDLELSALLESDYYAGLSRFFAPIRAMTWLTASMIGLGAVLGGFNMLYSAFASRIRELATLQAVGYSRTALFVSLLQESLLSTLMGTLLAAVLALGFLEGRTVNFSVGTFSLDLSAPVVSIALITGVALGIIGTIPPALRCLGASLPKALRSQS